MQKGLGISPFLIRSVSKIHIKDFKAALEVRDPVISKLCSAKGFDQFIANCILSNDYFKI